MQNKRQKISLLKLPLILSTLTMGLSACGMLGYQYQPQSVSAPQLQAVTPVEPIATPSIPATESKTYEISYKNEAALPQKNRDYTGNLIKASKGDKPSVLIGLPADDASTDTSYAPKEYNLFATKGYFNTREQLIEKALIFQKFDVRDRSKFEAILRDLRDKTRNTNHFNNSDNLTSGAKARVRLLETQLKGKLISEKEFDQKVNAIYADGSNIDSSYGQNRGEDGKEMTDTSEMIRAANGRADYLLLVNEFKINQLKDSKIDFTKNAEFEEIRATLKKEIPFDEYKELQTSITAPGYSAKFTAKLINVKTGSIEWIGSYVVTSSDIREFDIEFSYDKVVSNKDHVIGTIEDFNNKLAQSELNLENAETQYKVSHQQAASAREFDSEDRMKQHLQRVTSSYANAALNYQTAVAQYNTLKAEKEALISTMEWDYDHQFRDPIVRPDIVKLNTKENAAEFESHVHELLDTVIHSLIRTIEVDD